MQWRKERDLLVAQTLAFVQSVAGKKGDAKVDAVDANARLDDLAPGIEAALIDAMKITAPPDTSQSRTMIPANDIQPPVIQPPVIQPAAIKTSRAIVPTDVRAEMQARVANFRKHQERFNRDREEYYSATYAKLRAAISSDSVAPPPRK